MNDLAAPGAHPSSFDRLAAELAGECGVDLLIARVLLARGVSTPEAARRFLTPSLARDWRDPEGLPGMPECADAVAAAVRAGTRIVVFGDFDVDGLTAAALAVRGLRAMGADVSALVPHRFTEGYGLTDAALSRIRALEPGLVVTVDCGISSAAEVAALRADGIGVVVTDHHEPGDAVPRDVPVCDPKLGECGFDGLAGAGVALKLIAAVGARLDAGEVWPTLIGLAALGTIADAVPLLDENRALAADGLAALRSDPPAGIAALCTAAGVDVRELSSERVAFGIAPRLNAAGRIADAAEALELLLTDDQRRAGALAADLERHNRTRQTEEARLLEMALEQAETVMRPGARCLVLSGDAWHEGVRGIVASRLASRFGVPTLLLCVDDGEARGSGRSVGSVDLHAAVSTCAPLLSRFGGHAAAVGLSLPTSHIAEFRDAVDAALAQVPADRFDPPPAVDADIELSQVTARLARDLDRLEPFGEANPRPSFRTRGVAVGAPKRVGERGDHLKFDARDGLASVPAIAFRCHDIERFEAGGEADLVYTVSADTWAGRRRVQLMVTRLEQPRELAAGPAADLVDRLFAQAEATLKRGDYEGVADAESFHTKLAGVSFEGRQETVRRLAPGTPLTLARRPDNEYDACAVAVLEPSGEQVGFLNRRLAAVLAPLMDEGAGWEAVVTDITGEGKGDSLGVNVRLTRDGAGAAADDEDARAARRARLASLDAQALEREIASALIGGASLHEAQRQALAHLGDGHSCLTVMATGRGKSAIFQTHAARLALAGGHASVFVYPLRALVADQAYHLAEAFGSLGLAVAVVTGETGASARDGAFAALADGRLHVVLTTPEFLEHNVSRFAEAGRVRFLVVDEAHHIGRARAGNRPAYARLDRVLEALGGPRVCAVTATCTDESAAAIRCTLGIERLVLDPSRRDNLDVDDRRGGGDRGEHLRRIVADGEKTIVYVGSREHSVRVAERIRQSVRGLRDRVAFYNGGLPRASRHEVETAFRAGDVTVVVATSAFGEGVDIPDVRHVVLHHLPFDRVEFNQACGRAGRDGLPATVHLLYGERDAKLNQLILGSDAPDLDDLRALYAAVRARAKAAEDGPVSATNAELAEDVKARRAASRLTDRGVSTGLAIFREMELLRSDGLSSARTLELLPVEGTIDITGSVRYAEGLAGLREFDDFRGWALSAPADEVRAAFDRPILPSS